MIHYYLIASVHIHEGLYKLEIDGSLWGWSDEKKAWSETYFVSDVDQMKSFGRYVTADQLTNHPAFKKENFYKDVLSESKSE